MEEERGSVCQGLRLRIPERIFVFPCVCEGLQNQIPIELLFQEIGELSKPYRSFPESIAVAEILEVNNYIFI